MEELMSKNLAEILFPSTLDTDEIFAQYPTRQLPKDAIITRFAPSPTGFVHIGSVYIAQVGRILAQQSGGIFILRIEDTDQQRQIERGVEQIVENLLEFRLEPDEGPFAVDPLQERGAYGPYQQSHRRSIYQAFAKRLVAQGLAYPSFQTAEELQGIREEQERTKNQIGYYGPWAKDRDLTIEQIQEKLDIGLPFAIRIRSPYPNIEKIMIDDAIRGRLEFPANDRDYVLLKTDGLPTYHFAMVIDDTLMRVNLVLRGDEWLSTLPLHIQLFNAFDFKQPTFAHIAPIGKKEGNNKRKLSKRKDPEAAVSYYFEKGYPTDAILAYLLNIANSGFEEWFAKNNPTPLSCYPLKLSDMAPSIALFDLQKLDSVSREIIANYSIDTLYAYALAWAQQHAPQVALWLTDDPEYARLAINIGRNDTPPRKDLTKWSDIESSRGFFFDDYYSQSLETYGYQFSAMETDIIINVLDHCLKATAELGDKETWLQDMKTYSVANGFALDQRDFKRNPTQYKGVFGQLIGAYRIALTNQLNTPDLHQIITIMGTERVSARLKHALAWLRENSSK
jgi:glutamyl-tRNA synthetase